MAGGLKVVVRKIIWLGIEKFYCEEATSYSASKSCGLFNSGSSRWHMANTESVTISRVPDIP